MMFARIFPPCPELWVRPLLLCVCVCVFCACTYISHGAYPSNDQQMCKHLFCPDILEMSRDVVLFAVVYLCVCGVYWIIGSAWTNKCTSSVRLYIYYTHIRSLCRVVSKAPHRAIQKYRNTHEWLVRIFRQKNTVRAVHNHARPRRCARCPSFYCLYAQDAHHRRSRRRLFDKQDMVLLRFRRVLSLPLSLALLCGGGSKHSFALLCVSKGIFTGIYAGFCCETI